MTADDARYMQRALELAARGAASTHPNPCVGCVLVKEGRVIAEAWHRKAGEAHAEALALQAAGEAARGATAYVTLEPCSHFGRTPPCADALVQAGIARVVVAMQDPDERVAGRGIERLQSAGIEVEVGLCQTQACELNRGFISRNTRGRPWLTLKLAASLDGRTAMASGESRWISGVAAREDVHRWRAEAGAVLSTSATVLVDNSRLNVRLPGDWRQPDRIVLDRGGQVPPDAPVWAAGARRIAVIGEAVADATRSSLRAAGVEVLPAAADEEGFDLPAILQALGKAGINSLLVECGARLGGSLLAAGLVDELLIYLAPCLLGAEARPLARLAELAHLADAPRWRFVESAMIGEDLRCRLRPAAGAHDLHLKPPEA